MSTWCLYSSRSKREKNQHLYEITIRRMLPRFRSSILPRGPYGIHVHILSPSRKPDNSFVFGKRSFFQGANSHTSKWPFSRKLLYAVPAVGLIAFIIRPRPKSAVKTFFSSPTIIPCSQEPAMTQGPTLVHSPYEEQPFLSRVTHFIKIYIFEPFLTARRFIYLCTLFIPVLVTVPMLLVGELGSGDTSQRRLSNGKARRGRRRRSRFNGGEGERWGAVWWYGFLVRRMEKAGPTFIKVSHYSFFRAKNKPVGLVGAMGSIASRFVP